MLWVFDIRVFYLLIFAVLVLLELGLLFNVGVVVFLCVSYVDFRHL